MENILKESKQADLKMIRKKMVDGKIFCEKARKIKLDSERTKIREYLYITNGRYFQTKIREC